MHHHPNQHDTQWSQDYDTLLFKWIHGGKVICLKSTAALGYSQVSRTTTNHSSKERVPRRTCGLGTEQPIKMPLPTLQNPAFVPSSGSWFWLPANVDSGKSQIMLKELGCYYPRERPALSSQPSATQSVMSMWRMSKGSVYSLSTSQLS